MYGMDFSWFVPLRCAQRDERGLVFVYGLERDWHLSVGFVGFESPFCVGCHFEVGRNFEHRMGERRAEVVAVAGITEVWGSRPVL